MRGEGPDDVTAPRRHRCAKVGLLPEKNLEEPHRPGDGSRLVAAVDGLDEVGLPPRRREALAVDDAGVEVFAVHVYTRPEEAQRADSAERVEGLGGMGLQ